MPNRKQIQLSHGGGGEETNSLIHNLFYRYFNNDIFIAAEDAAVLEVEGKIAFTTEEGFSFDELETIVQIDG